MTRHVLMIAFHFPPMKGSSGIQRTLKFCQYLPQFGWNPIVLSATESAYETISQDQMHEIPQNIVVKRAFALDTARHLSINGKYPRFLAIPDRWASWLLGGVASGLRLIHKTKPRIIWSTYPISTAHLIAYVLHRLTGVPWVADLRDPMAQDDYPTDPVIWKAFKWIETKIARYASAICFTSPGQIDEFLGKHGNIVAPNKLCVIENGYDEECFSAAVELAKINPPNDGRPLTLVHSGIIYPLERDPRPFFHALANLRQAGIIGSTSLQIIFRASGHDTYLQPIIQSSGLNDIIHLSPTIPYLEALAEMLSADGLLLFQAPCCNYQIPAKLYEYIRAGRPILALTDKQGDTASVLGKLPMNMIADITSATDIEEKVRLFLDYLASGIKNIAPRHDAAIFSRREKSRELAALLDSIIFQNN